MEQGNATGAPADNSAVPIIYTIGHSTRTREALIELLVEFGVSTLIDIRRIPFSRYNPQFNREEMILSMPAAGIRYEHFGELGGRRPPQEGPKWPVNPNRP